MKRQNIRYVTLGILLGLVGCTERNPAFHKPVDGGASPSQDTAMADTPINVDRPPSDAPIPPKDAEPRPETPIEPADAGLDGPRLVDSAADTGTELLDARGWDTHADNGGSTDTAQAQDAKLDAWVADTTIIVPTDVLPVTIDAEQADVPAPAEDAPLEIDAHAGDASVLGDVLPDAEEPDAWPDAEDAELDSQALTDV